jgi:heat shock protein HslJ/WD40 repeat protein
MPETVPDPHFEADLFALRLGQAQPGMDEKTQAYRQRLGLGLALEADDFDLDAGYRAKLRERLQIRAEATLTRSGRWRAGSAIKAAAVVALAIAIIFSLDWMVGHLRPGVGIQTTSTPAKTPTPASPLAGTAWHLLKVNGRGYIGNPVIVLAFNGDHTVRGTAVCHPYTASYSVDGNSLQITAFNMESGSCPEYNPGIQAAEAFANLFPDVRSYRITNRNMELTTARGDSLTFELVVRGSVTPTPSAPASAPLSATGPWLLVSHQDGLTAFNADGSGGQLLDIPLLLNGGRDLQNGISPSGGVAALRVQEGDGIYLGLLHLAGDARFENLYRLDQPLASTPDTDHSAAYAAIYLGDLLGWSPDGKILPFTSMNGTATNLYAADLSSGSLVLQHLTSQSQQVYPLAWTPDGKGIVYAQVINCGGNGCNLDAVGLAGLDGQDRKLYDARGSHWETVVGFPAADQMIAMSADAGSALNLRRVDLSTGAVTGIYAGYVSAAAFDPLSKTLAFTVPDAMQDPLDSLSPGLYLVRDGGEPRLIAAGHWNQLFWSPQAGLFMVGGTTHDGALQIDPEGEITRYRGESWWSSRPQSSPDGKTLAFWGQRVDMVEMTGLRLYTPDGVLHMVTSLPVEALAWRPDGKALAFISQQMLYLYDVSSGDVSAIGGPFTMGFNDRIAWVNSTP